MLMVSWRCTRRITRDLRWRSILAMSARRAPSRKRCLSTGCRAENMKNSQMISEGVIVIPFGSLRLYACCPHHFTEHRIFVPQERIELPGRHRHRLGAELGEALFQVGALQRALRLGVQLREHFARR